MTEEAVVDIEAPEIHSSDDSEESAASSFALDLLLPDHRQLISAVRTQSHGSYCPIQVCGRGCGNSGERERWSTRHGRSVRLPRHLKSRPERPLGFGKQPSQGRRSRTPVAETIAAVFLPVNEMSEVDAALIQPRC